MSTPPVRTCCIRCADWAVVVVHRRDPSTRGRPLVVRERVKSRELVRAASGEARAEGVVPGLSRREAEARCPGVTIAEVDTNEQARAFEPVARAIESLTPRIELDVPGRCSFPTRGPARYFGGDDALVARVRAVAAAVLGPDAGALRVGVADGRFAAALATDHGRDGIVVAPGEAAGFLAPHPVEVLGAAELAVLLVRLGILTLGAFAALERAAVLARFGVDGERLHRLARGDDDRPPILIEPPPDLATALEIDPPATRVDHVAFVAKGLADSFVARLAERGLGCTRVLVTAETEHGERLERAWRHEGAFTAATLTERVRWQLEGWLAAQAPAELAAGAIDDPRSRQDALATAESFDTTTGALTRLGLVPDEVVAASGRQLGFWGGDLAAADRADRAFARVQGMLGYDAVVTAVVQGGRTPAERVRWIPWGEPRDQERGSPHGTAGERAAWPGGVPRPEPARLFDPALPAELLDGSGRPVTVSGRGEASAPPALLRCGTLPGGGGPVVAWAGPWPHDLRWWDRDGRRRRALWQVVTETRAGVLACLVAVEHGRAGIEAWYD